MPGTDGGYDFLLGSLPPMEWGMLAYAHLSLKMKCPCAVSHTPWYRVWSLTPDLDHEQDKNMKSLTDATNTKSANSFLRFIPDTYAALFLTLHIYICVNVAPIAQTFSSASSPPNHCSWAQ